MSSRHARRSTKTLLFAVGLLLSAAPALGQGAPDITLKLSPAEVAEIVRLADLTAPNIVSPPPQAYWDLQAKLSEAVQADPDASRAVLSAMRASR
jgi:hypothetical protein